MNARFKLGVLVVFLVAASRAEAQVVPTPESVLGYMLGERYTPHWKILSYARAVDAASDRVAMKSYGRTYEGRDLVLLFVSAPANIARLDELRATMAKLADPRTLAPGEKAEALIAKLPVFVWLAYNVHGNETSCSEAALMALHALASDDGDATKRLLEDAVVIIDPCVNPDGRDRYVNWFNSVVGRRADPEARSREHDEPWPGGRFNHYYFDLNRDWAFMSQAETAARIAEYVRWTPQVYVDYHEMGAESSYFFFPAEKPINSNFPPTTAKWGEIFGRGNARAFDAKGWDYYTAEDFDLFYPGYGDTWPSLHGAIGMTYEQAGHGRAGAALKRRDGTTLTLADRVAHHYTTSLATIGTAVERRLELLVDFHEFRKSAIEEGRVGPIREFVLASGDDRERTARLVDLLIRQGVEIRRATKGFSARQLTDRFGKAHEEMSFKEGAYLVSLAQPAKRLIKTLLEPKTKIEELYFYDVAAWSLPFAYGVEAYQAAQPVDAASEPVKEAFRPKGRIEAGSPVYGWLARWDDTASVRAAVALLGRGILVKSSTKEFTLEGRGWKRGTLVIPRGGNPEDVGAILSEVALATGAVFTPAPTGMTEKGVDLGSQSVERLQKPRICLVGGEGTAATSYGAARFVLEEIYDIPFSTLELGALRSARLDEFTAVVFPSGEPRLDKPLEEALARFVRDGGVLLAFEDAAATFTKENGGFTAITMKVPEAGGDAKKAPPKKKLRLIEEREEEMRKLAAPGAILRVDLDPAHPLSFGYEAEIAVFKEGTASFDPEAGGTAIGRFVDAPMVSGYLAEEAEKALRDRAYAMVERLGRGQVVLLAGDPNFRCGWQGLSRLFLNAILLLPRP